MSSAPLVEKTLSKRVILDTNVLLADPNSVLSFPRAEVVIPETVLGELDKLKTARVDPDLRFRGREVSRLLFEFSEEGSLIDGVDLPDGGRMRVAPLDSDVSLPDGVGTRNADDRILATAYQVMQTAGPDVEVELITNDLNMLLKAQTLGIPVSRHGEGVEGGFARRYIIRPFQRYKIPLAILAMSLAVFAAVVALVFFLRPAAGPGAIPTEFRELLTTSQQQALDALVILQNNPENPEALRTMGNFYFGQASQAQQAGLRPAEIQASRAGVRYYERYLAVRPDDVDARSDMASLLFYSGQTDRAIQQVGQVLEDDSNHVNANFNLGIFYWQGRRDLQAAADQMNRVIELTEDDSREHGTLERARLALQQITLEAEASGQPINPTPGEMQ
jgi:rRNA-processing protein FCF1